MAVSSCEVTPLPAMTAQRPVPTSETIGRAIDAGQLGRGLCLRPCDAEEKCQDAFRNCFTQPRCLQSLACLSQPPGKSL